MSHAAPNAGWWRGRRVLVTGHTGFVGGWLCAWLAQLGARVSGLSLPPPTSPSFFASTGIESMLARSIIGDIGELAAVRSAISTSEPQVIFHLAAQAIVRDGFREPVATFATNVLGTVHVLEACRAAASLEKLVAYTTDKVYRNNESGRPFVEGDRLGGNEPYSSSKAAADWAVGAYWESFFRGAAPRIALATVRAGNIVGGGDWARDRLLPDAIRAFSQKAPLVIRSPASTRPWQHVLDVVRATLVLAERATSRDEPAEALAWNFGPRPGEVHAVADVATAAAQAWGHGASWRAGGDAAIPESTALSISSEKAERDLGWRCAWGLERAVTESVAWYRESQERPRGLLEFTFRQIEGHVADVRRGAQ